jgi:hypothetical protein
MVCWPAASARSIGFSMLSGVISPRPALSLSRSCETFNSSGLTLARCLSGISGFQCCVRRDR